MHGLRLGTHPLHPALVHFPIAFWTAAPLVDGVYLIQHGLVWWQLSWGLLAAGCLMALAAMVAGVMDLMTLPTTHPAQPTAQRHMLIMATAWCVFLLDLLLRPLDHAPTTALAWSGLGLSVAGWLILLAGAYAGAQLVYDHGVGRVTQHDSR